MDEREAFAKVREHLDKDELVALCLELGNIPSPYGFEGEAGQAVFDWTEREGFGPRKVGLLSDRFNVVATLEGGDGGSLGFNSHLDTGRRGDNPWLLREPDRRYYHEAWIDGDLIIGDGVINDKGPMAAFLIAAKAIRDAGITLGGDLHLTAVCGEIGMEPVDEYQGLNYQSKDIGARYMISHGPVIPDRVIVAEATSCKLVGLEAGKLHVKVTTFGHEVYTPYLGADRFEQNAILQMAGILEPLNAWIADYEASSPLDTPVGRCEPKVNIGAIRSGAPYRVTHTPEVCSIYLDVRLAPGQPPAPVLRSLRKALADNDEVRVEPFLYRAGHVVADDRPLIDGLGHAHHDVFGTEIEVNSGPTASMWRDINVFNEVGIPAVTYGPSRARNGLAVGVNIDEIFEVAQVYAASAIRICGVA